MTFLLDTNVISDMVRENLKIDARLAAISESDRVITCTIVRGESLFGIARLPPGRRRDEVSSKIMKVFSAIRCESVPAEASDHYARIKHACQIKGASLDENDLWIAATATALGAVVVTRDGDFRRVDGLSVEDWTA